MELVIFDLEIPFKTSAKVLVKKITAFRKNYLTKNITNTHWIKMNMTIKSFLMILLNKTSQPLNCNVWTFKNTTFGLAIKRRHYSHSKTRPR